MYSRECKTCHRNFPTGNYNDDLCPNCNGDMPKLKYYELEKEK